MPVNKENIFFNDITTSVDNINSSFCGHANLANDNIKKILIN